MAMAAAIGALQLAAPQPAAAIPGLELVQRDSFENRDEPFKRADTVCPPGKVVVGGGGEVLDGDRTAVALTRVAPFPVRDERGEFIATEFGAQAESVNGSRPYDWALRAYAICAPLTSLPGYAIKRGSTRGTVFQTATAVCPSGTVAYGSGASFFGAVGDRGKVFLQLNRTGGNHDLSRATARAVSGYNKDFTVSTTLMCAAPRGGIRFEDAIAQGSHASDRCGNGFFSHGIGGGGAPGADAGPVWLDKIAPHADLRGVDVSITGLFPDGQVLAHQRCAR